MSGQVSIAAGSYIQSPATDFTESEAVVEIVDAAPDSGGGAQFSVGNGKDGQFVLYTALIASNDPAVDGKPGILFGVWNLFNYVEIGALHYVPSIMRFWRLRNTGGYILWDVSGDSYTWLTIRIAEHGLTPEQLASMPVRIEHLNARTAGPIVFDNLNVPYTQEPDEVPATFTMDYMRADSRITNLWNGKNTIVGMIDQGTTAAMRARHNLTLVARKDFATPPASGKEIDVNAEHGCLTAACGVPHGGRIVDARVFNGDATFPAYYCAGIKWAAQMGAKVISVSLGGGASSQVEKDTWDYLQANYDVLIFIATGNDGENKLAWPAGWSLYYDFIHSVGAFCDRTFPEFGYKYDQRASFSNYTVNMTGVAPGAFVGGRVPSGAWCSWQGTSAATPDAAQLAALALDGSGATPKQVGIAMKTARRNTGQPDQGGGAYDFRATLQQLGVAGSSSAVLMTTIA